MKRAIILFVLIIGFFALQTFYRAGQFKTITNSSDKPITRVYTNMPGPEDMQLDWEKNILYISASDRRTGNSLDNGIYVLDLNSTDEPYKLATNFNGEFNPHGIYLLHQDSTLYLFAVNHNKQGDFVEIFSVDSTGLNHLQSISNDNMCCPNDLVALDLDKIYISNDHGVKRGMGRVLEDYLKIPRSSIMYYDGHTVEKVARPFHYANGINVSPDKSLLYLAETTGNAITTFKIGEDGSLQNMGSFDTGTGVDNIDIDPDGNLWVGGHPKLLDFVKHAKDSVNLSPSEVLKLSPTSNYNFVQEVIFMNNGEGVSGSSVAVNAKDELFIGVVHNRSVARIKVD